MTTRSKPPGQASAGGLLKLGSVVGVPVYITPSWLVVTALVTVVYADEIRQQVLGASASTGYLLSLIYALGLAASVLLHEIGHTVVSRALGLPVRRIVIFLLGGVSEIVGEPARPRDEFSIAAAGPAISFLLAGIFWGLDTALTAGTGAAVEIELLMWSNLIIAIFNVLPGLPLDGGRLVQALFWKVGSSRLVGVRVAAWSGRLLAVLLAAATLIAVLASDRNESSDVAGIGATAAGFAVSAFIFFGAGQALRQAVVIANARRLDLALLIRPAVYVPADLSLAEAVRRARERAATAIVVTDSHGRCRAVVDEAAVRAIEEGQLAWVSVASVAKELTATATISDQLHGQALLDALAAHRRTEYLVLGATGVAVGVLAAKDVAEALTADEWTKAREPDSMNRTR